MMSFSSLFEHGVKNPASCPWPSCKQPRTDSFRGNENVDEAISEHFDAVHKSDWCFTDSSESLESVIRGAVQSDRFFFEPGDKLILEEVKDDDERSLLEEGVALTVKSEDPYIDFRASMEEMVEVHGLEDLEWLLELLQWYLMMNRKRNHGLILRAFLDLLEGIASSFHCEEEHCDYFEESIEK